MKRCWCGMDWRKKFRRQEDIQFNSNRFTMGEYGVEYIEEIGSVLKEKAKY